MSKKVNVSESLELAAIKHNGKYDYSKVDYKRWNIPVTIICPEHGEFKQTLHNHLNGQGCPKCGIDTRANTGSDPNGAPMENALKTVTRKEIIENIRLS